MGSQWGVAMKISELAQATHLSPPTIRYYEGIGLLPPPSRVGGQRRYGTEDIRRLTFIRRCRDLGFPIEQVRLLSALADDDSRPCMEARDVAQAHLHAVREKLRTLGAIERSITGFIESADATCQGGPGADCAVLRDLGAEVQ